MTVQGRTAIVTGAGSGIGEGIAKGLARAGAKVCVADVNPHSMQRVVGEIQAEGGTALGVEVNLTQAEQVEAMCRRTVETFGRLDILVNNAGIIAPEVEIDEMSEETWDRIFAINLKSVMFTCKHVLPVMRAQGAGSIVNISSIAAIASTGLVSYKASKAALNAYTQSLATGGARHGIRANVIMPGLMNTPMAIETYVAAGFDRAKLIEQRNASVPLGRQMGSAWDVANAALFLASDEARFITGVCLPVDGGQSVMIG